MGDCEEDEDDEDDDDEEAEDEEGGLRPCERVNRPKGESANLLSPSPIPIP